MYRPIPADWLSPWWDKQEGQLTEDAWSGKLFGFIWICLALQFSRKVKGESKNRTAASIGNLVNCICWGGKQWILLLESYTLTMTKVASRHVARSQHVGCERKWGKLNEGLGDFDHPVWKVQSEYVPNGLREGGITAPDRPPSDLHWTHSLLLEVVQRNRNVSDSQHKEPET